jgi:membrane-associated protease RseP (regulator of RpoE activity)
MRRFCFVLVLSVLASLAVAAVNGDSGKAQKGWLGVYSEELSKPMLVALDIERGVLVTEVAERSPASAAGIEMGDVITAVDGASIESPSDLRRAVRERPGRKVDVVLRRKGQEKRVSATLEARDFGALPGEFEWQGAPLEALRQARKAIREIAPETRKGAKVYRESMDSLRQELENLKHELDQLREQVQKKEKRG